MAHLWWYKYLPGGNDIIYLSHHTFSSLPLIIFNTTFRHFKGVAVDFFGCTNFYHGKIVHLVVEVMDKLIG